MKQKLPSSRQATRRDRPRKEIAAARKCGGSVARREGGNKYKESQKEKKGALKSIMSLKIKICSQREKGETCT